ncbi:hypothetical protein A3Q56_02404 [Intoshia linei]|uniref:Uncharacterized protein n=1 Tax=Intoshia linei TaxID=1819745 RepID=A0A177B6I9_9BILA|nr:hypothetical protein A3Q56_02404 [Intoshia linei]
MNAETNARMREVEYGAYDVKKLNFFKVGGGEIMNPLTRPIKVDKNVNFMSTYKREYKPINLNLLINDKMNLKKLENVCISQLLSDEITEEAVKEIEIPTCIKIHKTNFSENKNKIRMFHKSTYTDDFFCKIPPLDKQIGNFQVDNILDTIQNDNEDCKTITSINTVDSTNVNLIQSHQQYQSCSKSDRFENQNLPLIKKKSLTTKIVEKLPYAFVPLEFPQGKTKIQKKVPLVNLNMEKNVIQKELHDKRTIMKDSYRNWHSTRPIIYRVNSNLAVGNGNIEWVQTYKSDYILKPHDISLKVEAAAIKSKNTGNSMSIFQTGENHVDKEKIESIVERVKFHFKKGRKKLKNSLPQVAKIHKKIRKESFENLNQIKNEILLKDYNYKVDTIKRYPHWPNINRPKIEKPKDQIFIDNAHFSNETSTASQFVEHKIVPKVLYNQNTNINPNLNQNGPIKDFEKDQKLLKLDCLNYLESCSINQKYLTVQRRDYRKLNKSRRSKLQPTPISVL